jgi:flagellar basal-body rod protein FlgC
MAGIQNIFDISGRAMSAQLTRLNTVASNLANAKSFAGSKQEAFVGHQAGIRN